jgi:hypothetical protein
MNRNRFRIAAALLCGALALTQASPAGAFIRLTRTAADGVHVVQAHWNNSELPLNIVVNPANSSKSDAVALAEIQAGAQSWEDISTSYFSENTHLYVGAPDIPPALAFDGQNSVLFDPTGAIGNFASGVIAFTRSFIDDTDGHTLDSDVLFNDRDFYWSTTSPGIEPAPPGKSSVDLQAVICHEFGHAFGLDHTSVLGATMIPFIQNDTSQRTLELDDTAGNSVIYPEPSFAATTGTISGTVVSGFNSSAIFGAHVEAWLISSPTSDHSISAISGELTLRNGQGDWEIHGLPPGSYAVRIVPLDGVHTTATDANVGGPYNGLDTDFEVEWWNGASESGNGFTDNPDDYTPVSVSAGGAVSGVNFVTNTYPGRVTIAQYGAFENVVTYRNTGFLAVRFDPPFGSAYNIDKITFPSFTFDGAPAHFLSAKLCVLDPATGAPDVAAPLVSITPFVGSPNGVNDVTVNLPGAIGQTYFWMLEFPNAATTPGFPLNFPFLRMDYVQMERGHFGNTYSLPTTITPPGISIDRNATVSMQCQLADPSQTPIDAPSNLAWNVLDTKSEYHYVAPGDVRADGFPMPNNSLDHVELVARTLAPPTTYSTVASGGAGASMISVNGPPPNPATVIYATQAVDKNGNRSILSPCVVELSRDADEPNGQLHQAAVLTTPVVNRPESYSPAGDQDYFEITAKPGDMIVASATHTGSLDGRNDPDYTMFLFDVSGEIVAYNDDFVGLDPRVVYTVPPPSGNSRSTAPRKFTILVQDFYGSLLSPNSAPRIPSPLTYRLDVDVTTPVNAAASFARGLSLDRFGFANGGPNPANPIAKLVYVVPKSAGAVGVQVKVFDVSGRLVRTLVDGTQDPGVHGVIWDGRNESGMVVASGRYFARMSASTGYTETQSVTILK